MQLLDTQTNCQTGHDEVLVLARLQWTKGRENYKLYYLYIVGRGRGVYSVLKTLKYRVVKIQYKNHPNFHQVVLLI